ncbi:Ribosomal l32 protein [Rutstroemia sp. NJR-2017a WRK4]|nr:Ribosomal l32 protein [Rutstroemia sp. NJR-2017a WRK4]
MEQNICKALVRYVSPDSYRPRLPRNFPPLTFFSFPREIRDKIYHYALVSTSHITVWKGKLHYDYVRLYKGAQLIGWGEPTSRLIWRTVSHEETSASLSTININLLFSSKTVSQEAAMVFYNKNAFAFEGDHNWDPIVLWLKTIGIDNRNSLAAVEVCGKRPDQVWQNRFGERLPHPGRWTMEEIYPRHPYLGAPTDGFKYGCVDNINPALEEVFVLLGQRTSEKKTTIIMRTDSRYPGGGAISVEPDDPCPEYGWYSMELPNLIEKFLELHCSHSERRSVEVVWKGLTYQRVLTTEFMENLGWNVSISPVEYEEAVREVGEYTSSRDFARSKYGQRCLLVDTMFVWDDGIPKQE